MRFVLCLVLLFISACTRETVTEEKPKKETITIALCQNKEFNPHNSLSQGLMFVYEPLFYKEKPILAKKAEAQGKKAQIMLKDDVIWHDGTPFTADDAVHAINLVASGNSVYKVPSLKGAVKTGRNSLQVEFFRNIQNPEKLLTFPIVKKDTDKLLGTGRFCFERRMSQDTFLFRSFEGYRQKLPPKLLKIICVRDKASETSLFQAGISDVVWLDNDSFISFCRDKNTSVTKTPTNHMIMIGINCISLPKSVRRAIYNQTDGGELCRNAFKNTAKNIKKTDLTNTHFALEEMIKGGFSKTIPVKVAVQNEYRHICLAKEFKENLGKIGIECFLDITDSPFEEFQKGIYDMVIGTKEINDGVSTLVGENNILLYKNDYLLHLIKSDEQSVQINNILREDVPFIPIGYLYEAVAVKKDAGGSHEENLYNYNAG